MQTKLTLKLDDKVIRSAKKYARKNHQSLSRMVDGYFRSLTMRKNESTRSISPAVASLIGVLNGRSKEAKAEYADYLAKKYS